LPLTISPTTMPSTVPATAPSVASLPTNHRLRVLPPPSCLLPDPFHLRPKPVVVRISNQYQSCPSFPFTSQRQSCELMKAKPFLLMHPFIFVRYPK
jgi:hypothetical protein